MRGSEQNAEQYIKLGNEMFYLWGPNLALPEFAVSLGQLLMTLKESSIKLLSALSRNWGPFAWITKDLSELVPMRSPESIIV